MDAHELPMQGSSAEPLFCVRRLFGLESTLDGQGFGSFSDCSFSGLDFVVVWLAQFSFGIPLIKSMPKIGCFCAEKEPRGRVGDGSNLDMDFRCIYRMLHDVILLLLLVFFLKGNI